MIPGGSLTDQDQRIYNRKCIYTIESAYLILHLLRLDSYCLVSVVQTIHAILCTTPSELDG